MRHACTATATGTPSTSVHPVAAAPAAHHTGPKSASAPDPMGPPATAARHAVSSPHTTAPSAAVRAVSPYGTSRARRTANHPTSSPATTGTPTAAHVSGDPGPAGGSAASRGKRGSAGEPSKPSGVAVAPVPSATPGPRAYAAPHTAAFGTSPNATSSTANLPDHTPVSWRNDSCAAPACHIKDAPTTSAPPPNSTSAPALPARSADAQRGWPSARREEAGAAPGPGGGG
ncbi:hypothetical protein GPJ59_35990, partial [Streptomyces bambusae]|nr:hypothetical protein [Streptomyces bambusae]